MSLPPDPSQKDGQQVLRYAFDDASGKLRVDAVISPDGHDLEINHSDDSIAIGTPDDLFTSTTVGPKIGLDVNVINEGDLATAANQITSNSILTDIDSKVPADLTTSASRLLVDGSGVTQPVSGTVAVSNFPVTQAVTGPLTDAQLRTSAVPVSLTSTPLPTNAATESKQDVGNTSLANIDSKTPALGQALNAGSVPVVLTASQLSTLTPLSSVSVSNFPATQPISAASLPLPTGASTLAAQSTGNTSLASIDSKLSAPIAVSGPLTDAQLRATPVPISGTITATPTGTQDVNIVSSVELEIKNDIGNPVPVSASSLPLPAGASTAANQTTANTSLASIDTKLTSPITVTGTLTDAQLRAAPVPVSGTVTANAGTNLNTSALALESGGHLASVDSKLPSNLTVTSTRLLIDGSGVTQPISATSLPLPTGAATAALQTQPGVDIGDVTINNASGISAVNIQDGGNSITVDGTVNAAQSGTWNVTNVSGTVSLPTGASTSALQTTGNSSLSSIDSKVPSNLTVTSTRLLVDGSGVTQPISGTIAATQSGTWTVQPGNTANTTAWKVDGSSVTQPVSAASLPLPSGAATSALQTTGNTSLASIDGKITAVNTGAVVVSSSVLPSGASTSALQTTGNTSLSNIDSKIPSNLTVTSTRLLTDGSGVTQPVSAASLPLPTGAATESTLSTLNGKVPSNLTVTSTRLLVDGSGVTQPVSGTVSAAQSGTWNVTNVSGTVSLPTGAATSALQTTGNTSLSSIDGKLNSLGQKVMTASVPVTIASDQTLIQDRTSTFTFNGNGQNLDLDCSGCSTAVIQITGTWVGDISFFVSTDGVNFLMATSLVNDYSPSDFVTFTNINGIFRTTISGYKTFRAQSNSWSSGSASATVIGSPGASMIQNISGTLATAGKAYLYSGDMVSINVGQQAMAASLPVVISSNQSAIPITGSITATNPSVSTTGAAVPASATLVGGKDGSGNLQPVKVSAAGVLSVDASGVAVPVTDNSGSLTVDNNGTFAVQASIAAAQTLATVTTVGTVSTITNVVHVDDNSGSLTVDNGGTFAVQATIAAAATNIAKAEDVASADADVGVPAMAIRKATPANTSGTDGDYEMLQMSAGRLWASATIDNANGASAVNIQDGGNSITVDGAVTASIAAAQTLATVTTVGAVTAITNALPAGSNVIGHVIADSGSTTAVTGNVASTVADGANVTLGAKADAKSAATDTTPISVISILKQISASVQAPPSQAVTNTGTFAAQATIADSVATGSITTQNLNPSSGTATAGSTIGLSAMNSNSTVAIQVTGTYTGALTPQISVDGANWIALAALTNTNTGAQSATIASAATGIWIAKVPASIKFRISANAAVTGTATVSLQSSLAHGLTTVDTPLPTGTNVLGAVTQSGTWTVQPGNTANTTAWKVDASSVAVPVTDNSGSLTVDNAGTFAVQAALNAETTKVIGTVNIASGQTVGISSGSAVIGHVIADSGSTTAVTGNVASTVADGADVTLGAKADAKSTATDTTPISVMSVLKQISASVQAPPSQAVTNAGTFAVQATLQAASGVDIGKLTANQSVNTAQVNGSTTVASVTGVQDVMPRKRTGATGLSPNYSASHITTKTTTTPTAATAYVSAIAIACSGAGTAFTMVIQNKEATPKILVPSFTLTVPTTGLPVILQFAEPILMTSGIDIVTGGTTAGTVDVFITYWQ